MRQCAVRILGVHVYPVNAGLAGCKRYRIAFRIRFRLLLQCPFILIDVIVVGIRLFGSRLAALRCKSPRYAFAERDFALIHRYLDRQRRVLCFDIFMRCRDNLSFSVLDIDDHAVLARIRRRKFDRIVRRIRFRALLLVPSVLVHVIEVGVGLRFRYIAALRRYRPRDLFADLHRFRVRRYIRRQFRQFRLTYGHIIAVCIHRIRSCAFYVCSNSVLSCFSRRIGERIFRRILGRFGHQIPCVLIYIEIIRIVSSAARCVRFPRNRLAEFNIRRFGRHRDRKRRYIFSSPGILRSFMLRTITLRVPKGGNRHIAETFFVPQIVFQFGDAVFNVTFDYTNSGIIPRQNHRHMFFPIRVAQEYQIALLRLIILVRQPASQRAAHIGSGSGNREL